MSGFFFFGRHPVKLDEKSRIVIPAVFRKDIPEKTLRGYYWLTPHQTGYIIVRPENVFEAFLQQNHEDMRDRPRDFNQFKQLIFEHSQKQTLDGKHRIVLSQEMRGNLKFTDPKPREDVIIRGTGDSFEIWPKALYEQFEQQRKPLETLSRMINDLGFGVDLKSGE